jgi:hypothetical protein
MNYGLCPPKDTLESELPVPPSVTLFRHRVFVEVIMIRRSLGWALIQYDWCPYKKGKFCKETQKDDSSLPAKERGLE